MAEKVDLKTDGGGERVSDGILQEEEEEEEKKEEEEEEEDFIN